MSPATAWAVIWAVGLGALALAVGLWARRERRRRIQAERERHTLEQDLLKHAEILAAAPDGFFLWDHADGRTECSRRLAVLLKLAAGTGASFDDVLAGFAPADADDLRRAVENLRANGKPFDRKLPLRAPTAQTPRRWLRVSGVRAATLDDRPLADIVWFRDTGEREEPADPPAPRVTEPAPPPPPEPAPIPVAAKEPDPAPDPTPDSTTVLDALDVPCAVFDSETRLRAANAAYAALWGLSPEWLETKPTIGSVLDAMRENRRLPEVADYRAFKEEQRALFETLRERRETLLHLPGGATLKGTVSPTGDGGLLFAYEDMTDRLALERSFNAATAVQRATLDRLYEGVAVFGGDGLLKLSNPAFAALWDIDPATLDDRTHIAVFAERLRPPELDDGAWPAHKERMIAHLLSREPAAGRLHRPDGKILDYANVPLPDGAVLLSYLDVTDSARLEEALTQKAEALDEANKLKSNFIANVSYEVRTPLNAVLGFAEVLADEYFGALSPRQREYIEKIRETTQGLATVVNDVLDLASIEAGLMDLDLDTIDIHAMMVAMLNLIRERARHKHLKVTFDCPPDIGWMAADEKRLKQVLYNVLSNAIRFTPRHGTVTFKAARDGETIVFTVTDTGVGIPQADQARIFRTFERAGNDDKTGDAAGDGTDGGAGLGLSLVKSFVELHGGSVDLKSRPGRGTTFTCRLPGGPAQSGEARHVS